MNTLQILRLLLIKLLITGRSRLIATPIRLYGKTHFYERARYVTGPITSGVQFLQSIVYFRIAFWKVLVLSSALVFLLVF